MTDFDAQALEKLEGFESDGRPLAQVLYDEFLSSGPRDLGRMRDARGGGRLDQVRHLAHSLKSSCRTLGLMRLGALCEQIEHATDGELDQAFAQLDDAYRAGCRWLDQRLGRD